MVLHCNVDVSFICGISCACCYEGGMDVVIDAAAVTVSVHARVNIDIRRMWVKWQWLCLVL